MRYYLIILFCVFAGRSFAGSVYYLDSRAGDDGHSGLSADAPWKSFGRLAAVRLRPGDSVCFRRGSLFSGRLVVLDSGTRGRPIVLTDYGVAGDPAPLFTNPVFTDGTYGNCIRVRGSWVVVERLAFYGTAAYSPVAYPGEGWVEWEMGAVNLERSAEHCTVRYNEMRDCVAGVRSNGAWALIEHNYIHDCNRVLKEWNWGPLGIWMGADHQEVCFNRVINISAVDPRIGWGPNAYGSGADGGAFEIDDARYDKSDISIHDNETRDNQGFLEVTWTDVKKNPAYRGFRVFGNVSDDFQQFVALWRGSGCVIEGNTIVRRKVNANEWGVFNITENHSRNIVRGNTIVTGKGVVIFNVGKKGTAAPETIIVGNRYSAEGDSLHMGKEGPGDSAVFGGYRWRIAGGGKALVGIEVLRGVVAARGVAAARGVVDSRGTAARGAAAGTSGLAVSGASEMAAADASDLVAAGQFAAAELKRYLQKMSGGDFVVGSSKRVGRPVIELVLADSLGGDGYLIDVRGKDLVLAGGSDRALLYAVYDLLHRLGCVWAAPQLDCFSGKGEYVPAVSELMYMAAGPVRESPALAYRKLDVEEGRTHTIENLRELIEWMPKVRLNVLQAPLNYQGAGRVCWDHWREALTPELKKRGLLIEVGGHGYQNFLGARMENGALFRQHPDWFGQDRNGAPDTMMRVVFNTSNRDAVNYFLGGVERYLRARPEIDIFDCWPPDVAKWAQSPAMAALGPAVDRQARLMNLVDSVARRVRPGLKVEIIAYGQVLEPPGADERAAEATALGSVGPAAASAATAVGATVFVRGVALSKNILVDFCPINQSFEGPLYDTSLFANAGYFQAAGNWSRRFGGDLALYSYYRKYAWHSLPVVLPHFMQQELRWYRGLGFRGVSTYAEPGDWYTYGLNHYVLAGLAWDVDAPVDMLMDEYLRGVYGDSRGVALTAYRELETGVRQLGSIPYTRMKGAGALDSAITVLTDCRRRVDSAGLTKLGLMLDYAIGDWEILRLRASGSGAAAVEARVAALVGLLEQHANEGLFVLYGKDNLGIFLNHYNSLK